MPWEIEAEPHTLRVRITLPMPPVQDVLRAISSRTTNRVRSVHLPTHVPGGTKDDEQKLQQIWQAVMDAGMIVYRHDPSEEASAAKAILTSTEPSPSP